MKAYEGPRLVKGKFKLTTRATILGNVRSQLFSINSMGSLGKYAEYLSGKRIQEPIFLPPTVTILLQKRIEDEENRIALLSARIDQPLQQINQSRYTVAIIRDFLSPIRRLPPEILEEIFFQYVHLDDPPRRGDNDPQKRLYDQLPPAVLLSHICSYWRYVAHGASRLWTQLHIPRLRGDKPPPVAVVSGWLQRSQPLLIDLVIGHSSPDSADEWDPYPDLLAFFSGRLRSLEIIDISSLRPFPRRRSLSFPNLENLAILDASYTSRPILNLGNTFSDAPQLLILTFLSAVVYLDSSLQFPFPTSRLASLSLNCWSQNVVVLQDIMLACPHLEKCQLLGVASAEIFFASESLQELSLRHLLITFSDDDAVEHIFSGLRLPALEELDLEMPGRQSMRSSPVIKHLEDLYDRSGFMLRKLRLCLFDADTIHDILDLLKRLPTLQSLALEECVVHVPILCLALRASPDTNISDIIVPNLTKLSITEEPAHLYDLALNQDDNPPLTADFIISDMILSRWKPYGDGDASHGSVSRLTGGFTFEAYQRDLDERVMATLGQCEEEGMPLTITRLVTP